MPRRYVPQRGDLVWLSFTRKQARAPGASCAGALPAAYNVRSGWFWSVR
jgi:hypothetical protein